MPAAVENVVAIPSCHVHSIRVNDWNAQVQRNNNCFCRTDVRARCRELLGQPENMAEEKAVKRWEKQKDAQRTKQKWMKKAKTGDLEAARLEIAWI